MTGKYFESVGSRSSRAHESTDVVRITGPVGNPNGSPLLGLLGSNGCSPLPIAGTKLLQGTVLEYPEYSEVQIPDGLDWLRRVPLVGRLVPANRLPCVPTVQAGQNIARFSPLTSHFYLKGDLLADYLDDRGILWHGILVRDVLPDGSLELVITGGLLNIRDSYTGDLR